MKNIFWKSEWPTCVRLVFSFLFFFSTYLFFFLSCTESFQFGSCFGRSNFLFFFGFCNTGIWWTARRFCWRRIKSSLLQTRDNWRKYTPNICLTGTIILYLWYHLGWTLWMIEFAKFGFASGTSVSSTFWTTSLCNWAFLFFFSGYTAREICICIILVASSIWVFSTATGFWCTVYC